MQIRDCTCTHIMSTTNSTSSWVPNNNESSAYVGAAPNTQRDWYIVRGLLRAVGQGDVDPAEGYILAPQDNGEPYVSKRPAVIAGIIIAMVAITIVTSVRLGLRVSMSQMRLGADDCATIAAAVCLPIWFFFFFFYLADTITNPSIIF